MPEPEPGSQNSEQSELKAEEQVQPSGHRSAPVELKQEAESDAAALLDIDHTLIFKMNFFTKPLRTKKEFEESCGINKELLAALKKSGIRNIYLFTDMNAGVSDVFFRFMLVKYLESEGFEVKAVVTPPDLFFKRADQNVIDQFEKKEGEIASAFRSKEDRNRERDKAQHEIATRLLLEEGGQIAPGETFATALSTYLGKDYEKYKEFTFEKMLNGFEGLDFQAMAKDWVFPEDEEAKKACERIKKNADYLKGFADNAVQGQHSKGPLFKELVQHKKLKKVFYADDNLQAVRSVQAEVEAKELDAGVSICYVPNLEKAERSQNKANPNEPNEYREAYYELRAKDYVTAAQAAQTAVAGTPTLMNKEAMHRMQIEAKQAAESEIDSRKDLFTREKSPSDHLPCKVGSDMITYNVSVSMQAESLEEYQARLFNEVAPLIANMASSNSSVDFFLLQELPIISRGSLGTQFLYEVIKLLNEKSQEEAWDVTAQVDSSKCIIYRKSKYALDSQASKKLRDKLWDPNGEFDGASETVFPAIFKIKETHGKRGTKIAICNTNLANYEKSYLESVLQKFHAAALVLGCSETRVVGDLNQAIGMQASIQPTIGTEGGVTVTSKGMRRESYVLLHPQTGSEITSSVSAANKKMVDAELFLQEKIDHPSYSKHGLADAFLRSHSGVSLSHVREKLGYDQPISVQLIVNEYNFHRLDIVTPIPYLPYEKLIQDKLQGVKAELKPDGIHYYVNLSGGKEAAALPIIYKESLASIKSGYVGELKIANGYLDQSKRLVENINAEIRSIEARPSDGSVLAEKQAELKQAMASKDKLEENVKAIEFKIKQEYEKIKSECKGYEEYFANSANKNRFFTKAAVTTHKDVLVKSMLTKLKNLDEEKNGFSNAEKLESFFQVFGGYKIRPLAQSRDRMSAKCGKVLLSALLVTVGLSLVLAYPAYHGIKRVWRKEGAEKVKALDDSFEKTLGKKLS